MQACAAQLADGARKPVQRTGPRQTGQLLQKYFKLPLQQENRHPAKRQHPAQPENLLDNFGLVPAGQGGQPGHVTVGKAPTPLPVALLEIGKLFPAAVPGGQGRRKNGRILGNRMIARFGVESRCGIAAPLLRYGVEQGMKTDQVVVHILRPLDRLGRQVDIGDVDYRAELMPGIVGAVTIAAIEARPPFVEIKAFYDIREMNLIAPHGPLQHIDISEQAADRRKPYPGSRLENNAGGRDDVRDHPPGKV